MKRDLNINTDKLRELTSKLGGELRGNRLWPLAIVLLVAIVAVPIALSKSSSPAPSTPVASVPPPSGTALRALNVQTTPGQSRLPGKGRNPFGGQSSSASSSTGSTTSSSTAASSTGSTSAAATGTGAGASSAVHGATGGSTGVAPAPPTSTNTTPPSITPHKKPTPAPPGLTSTQSYDVSLAVTNSAGGLNTVDPLERLSVLPSAQQPLLVELGVLKGGSRVLFAVQPGAVVGGPGTCTPGPIDCEILSLGQDQTESLSIQSANGPQQVELFAVTGISAVDHGSAAAAQKARRQESAAGRSLLNASTLQALSLFQYQPSVGAVVDLSNLTARDP